MCPKPARRITSDVDPDQTLQNALSDLGLHGLNRPICLNNLGIYMYDNIIVTGCDGHVQLSIIHHDLFITLLSGSKAKTVLVKQPCYIQTKMYR